MIKFLLAVILTCFVFVYAPAQINATNALLFKNKTITLPDNSRTFNWQTFAATQKAINGKRFVIIQFKQLVTPSRRTQLLQSGIQLHDYIPGNGFTATIQKEIPGEVVLSTGIRSIVEIPADVKLSKALQQRKFPGWAVKKSGTIDVSVKIIDGLPVDDAIADLKNKQVEIVDVKLKQYHVIVVRVSQDKIEDLASISYIEYIEPVSAPDKKLNNDVRNNARANVLNAPVTAGGENLQGQGVTIGVGDDADITSHVDLIDRVINRAATVFNGHGVETSGTAAGAGIIEQLSQGVAPMATIVSQVFSGIILNAATYVAEYGMVVTNNSYGNITAECEYEGTYDLTSRMLDIQAFQLPELLHVFAVGNDGPFYTQCGYSGFHTVLGGYQSSKNIIDVAWGDKNAAVSPGSSYGPTSDGRIKPEISATGSDVRSPAANNTYNNDWGSSLASPAVAGGAALLVEKYRQLNAGSNPKSGLLKALLMNGATDIENPGPDYKSGFGWLNLNRSVDMIKNNRFLSASIAQSGVNNHTITVPAGLSQLKVMLYWHDPAAAVFASTALVNDVDLELVTPASTTILPWKLDSARNNLNEIAVRGADHINNTEQITIDDPIAGSYTIRVKGTAMNVNPSQEYFIVYDFIRPLIDLTFPSVGEPLVPGEMVTMKWDAFDRSNTSFTLQFSSDNGANWSAITTSLASNTREYLWTVPSINTNQAKVRLIRNNTSLQDESIPFTIVGQPSVTLSSTQCEGYFSFNWNAVGGATDYEVMVKQGAKMVSVATTNATNYTLSGLSKDSVYWVSVRARINGQPGRRADAISRKPNSGNCAGSISDNDLKVDSILSPNNGRKSTSTEIKTTDLVVRIKNLDDVAVTGFDVQYSINGSAFITQNVPATIAAGGTYVHTFTGVNFSAASAYNITAVVKKLGDAIAVNDTLKRLVKQLDNPPITLSYTENFDAAPASETIGTTTGLPALERWDLATTTPFGRARTFVNTGIAHSGNRAITLDAAHYVTSGNANYLTGTFNLSNYAFIFPDELGLTLEFWYKHHGQTSSPDNRVWARRSDTSAWIEIYNFDTQQPQEPGVWKKATVYVGNTSAGLQPSSSFQVRFGQQGTLAMGDNTSNAGITIDDFRLFANNHDFGIVSIDTPVINSCGLSSAVPLKITTKGFKSIPANVPVKYRLDNGPIVSEQFFGGVGTYTFSHTLDLSTPGDHKIDVWIDMPDDNDRSNDSIINYVIKNQPVVITFPYLQNFENGTGNWYATGRNSTWEFGTPSSIKINKAASGSKAWKTSLKGTYNDNELSYLYSPCFNISTMANPYLSMSLAIDFEQCNQEVCDKAWVEYSNDGRNWSRLGAYGEGTNWYNRSGDNVWDSAGFRRWHTASIALPAAAINLQLRVVVKSDVSLFKEGLAIDDIHIYDRTFEIYTGAPSSNPVTANVSGNAWQNFVQNGKIIASVNANGNDLGNTSVQAFINGGGFNAVRNINGQYYHDRSITIKPSNVSQPDSTSIRFYFTDAETDTLVRATSCAVCSRPVDAFSLGITKYNDADDTKENGTLSDNVSGVYSYITSNKVEKVPYDKGYYAEFKVKDFSEFYLNNGGVNMNQPLPLLLTSFTAVKQNKDVLLQWNSSNEINLEKYELQVVKSNDAYRQQQFVTLTTVAAKNQSQNSYSYNDVEANKTGARYYRLRMIDKNGNYSYSETKVIIFSTTGGWMVYPNPAKNYLQIVTQANTGTKVEMQMLNILGQVMWQKASVATGFIEKAQVDVARQKLAKGLYVVKILAGEDVRQFKVLIE